MKNDISKEISHKSEIIMAEKNENLKFDLEELKSLELTEIRGGKLDFDLTGLGCTVNNYVDGCGCAKKAE